MKLKVAYEIFKVLADRFPDAKKAFAELIGKMKEREITLDDVAGFRATLDTSISELDDAIKKAEENEAD